VIGTAFRLFRFLFLQTQQARRVLASKTRKTIVNVSNCRHPVIGIDHLRIIKVESRCTMSLPGAFGWTEQ
jgi:low affinity Fe/Cu permease